MSNRLSAPQRPSVREPLPCWAGVGVKRPYAVRVGGVVDNSGDGVVDDVVASVGDVQHAPVRRHADAVGLIDRVVHY